MSHHIADREGVIISALWTGATDALDLLSDLSKFPWLRKGEAWSRTCSFDSWYKRLSSMSPGSKRFEGKDLLYVKNGTRRTAQCKERLHNEKQIVNCRLLLKRI